MKSRFGTFVQTLIILLVVGLLGTYWAARHHVVLTEDGTIVLPKRYLSLVDAFADVRGWSYRQFKARPELTDALARGGYQDVLHRARIRELTRTMEDFAADAESIRAETARAVEQLSEQWQTLTKEFNESLDRVFTPLSQTNPASPRSVTRTPDVPPPLPPAPSPAG